MADIIEKALLTGLGVLSITREKAEDVVNELIEKGEIKKEKQSELIDRLLEKGKETRGEIEKTVEKTIHNVLERMDIPSRSDIESLEKRIKKLEKKIES